MKVSKKNLIEFLKEIHWLVHELYTVCSSCDFSMLFVQLIFKNRSVENQRFGLWRWERLLHISRLDVSSDFVLKIKIFLFWIFLPENIFLIINQIIFEMNYLIHRLKRQHWVYQTVQPELLFVCNASIKFWDTHMQESKFGKEAVQAL